MIAIRISAVLLASLLLTSPLLHAQAPAARSGSSSSSSSSGSSNPEQRPADRAHSTVEAAGSGTTQETNESLFQLAAALNVCGYDEGLDHSVPVRIEIREEMKREIAASPAAQASRDHLCTFIQQHRLSDPGQTISQYVYLALYTTPPPELTLTMSQTEMLPAATSVIGVLPLVRSFAEAIKLHLIWVEHRAEYEAILTQVHDPLTKMILGTNFYLRVPVSNYDGRRFVVLLEPMLAPSQVSSLLYDVNYFVVASPSAGTPVTLRVDDIRHTYLHYEVEPLIYTRSTTLDPFLPLLRHVQASPLDYVYKSDLPALLTECLIKAIEIHLMDVGLTPPQRPDAHGDRPAFERYNTALNIYTREAESIRHAAVVRDLRQGWVVTQYFYDGLAELQNQSTSLEEGMGPLLFGMEIGHETDFESHIVFEKTSTSDTVRRAPAPAPKPMDFAEAKLLTDPSAAEKIADSVLQDPSGDHGAAEYLLGRLSLMRGHPEDAVTHFTDSLKVAKDTHTLAMDHIYLGRLYDIEAEPERDKAIAEYKAALAVNDPRADTRATAESGLKKPFALPKRQQSSEDEAPLDPTGKAEKEANQPPAR